MEESVTDGPDHIGLRKSWMHTLALATTAQLAAAWQDWEGRPEVQPVRGPEAGLVMVRGRIDAEGARFNLGEATVSRATVRLCGAGLAQDTMGSAYVLGGDLEHARLAAIFDGLLADAGLRERVLAHVIRPLAEARADQDRDERAEARRTQVNFFTVSREHE